MRQDMKKNEQIEKEIERLNVIFADIPENKKDLVTGLIENAAFMRINLVELQKAVVEHGALIECKSGNGFETVKDNPAQKAYTTMIARYTQIINQLSNYLPEKPQMDDELLDFIGKR